MVRVVALQERQQALGEEIANSVSHGVGLLASLAASRFLSQLQASVETQRESWASACSRPPWSCCISHPLSFTPCPPCRAKRVFRILDHSAIYLLIAGTYTPFTLGVLRGTWGWTLFGLVWGLAAVGIVLKALGGVRYTTVSTLVYLAMGWLILIAADTVWTLVPTWGLFWLLAGGIAYTAGAVFFMAERIRYFHFVWHLFVVAGTACHFIAVLWYAA